MTRATGIQWTERTWNPVTGCVKISPGCKHCYALSFAHRLQKMGSEKYANGFEPKLHRASLDEPLSRRKPTMWFVNSMSDLFQDAVPFAFVDEVIKRINAKPDDVFQVLTKRAPRMREYFATRAVPPNMWLGVSVEDKRYGVPRIGELAAIEAKTRFLSVEPLLEDVGHLDLRGIHWVIVGGESGPRHRPMQAGWVRTLRDQCAGEGVAFFFKQWGGRTPKAGGRELDGRTHDGMPNGLLSPSRGAMEDVA